MKKISIIILLIGGYLFSKHGINKDIAPSEESVIQKEPTTTTINTSDNKSSLGNNTYPEKKLVIINKRCIGCARCAIIAPKNFVMNSSGLAEVISQENNTGRNSLTAIKNCPTKAIRI
jgi:ferredoxin